MTPLYDLLFEYAARKSLRLHMPGHKGKIDRGFLKDFSEFDLTELDVTDNLFEPTGAILEAERLYAELFGVKYALFSVNGSSSGNFAFAAQGKVVAVDRLSHKSLFEALRLMKKPTVVIERRVNDGMVEPISLKDIKETLELYPEIDVFVLTSPDYYGQTVNLPEIRAFLKAKGKKLFVDSAHGAHFGLSPLLPESAAKNSDACVVSVHKTLGGLNQTAVLLSDSDELIGDLKRDLYAFMTTSPSFGLMASIDFAREYAAENAGKYDVLYERRRIFDEKIKKIGLFSEKNDDFTRVVVNCEGYGVSAEEVGAALERENVFLEMTDKKRLVAITTIYDDEDVFERLYEALERIRSIFENRKEICEKTRKNAAYNDRKAAFGLKRYPLVGEVPISEADGCVSAETILKMPPCIPVLLDGETISAEVLKEIKSIPLQDGKERKKLKVRYERIDNV